MTGRYSDDEALRPIGEATHVPDDQLASSGDPRRQRSESIDSGYPNTPTAAETECVSCSASIPASQSKYQFCLVDYLGDEAIKTSQASDPTLLGIIHLVVKSSTFYGAVAKGGAAATLLTANEAEPAVDDYTLIYDLNDAPARQVTDRWPSLPGAVQVSSEEGAQLLSTARDRTGWNGRGASEHQEQSATRLYDQRGTGIREEIRLKEILNDAKDEQWLVPAIALTAATGEYNSESPPSLMPTTERLNCQDCGQVTDHRFETNESIPNETRTGQPIWECQRCGTARYGSAPD